MKTVTQIVCVLRSVDGSHQWVAAAGRHDLVNNESSMVGYFDSFEVRTGPSGSNVITCYEPSRSAKTTKLDINDFQTSGNAPAAGIQKSCVLRLVGSHHEYVDANGRFDLIAGETLVSGRAVRSTVKTGPSGSHSVSVWNFVGATQRSNVPQNDEIGRYALAELLQGDPRSIVIDGSTFSMPVDVSHLAARPSEYTGVAAQ